MRTTRIAFASSNNAYIDEHFGSADYFQIYDLAGGEVTYVEERRANPLCKGHCEGGFDEVTRLLKDVDAVFVLKIGESAAYHMIRQGIRVFEAHGFIDKIVSELLDEHFGQREAV